MKDLLSMILVFGAGFSTGTIAASAIIRHVLPEKTVWRADVVEQALKGTTGLQWVAKDYRIDVQVYDIEDGRLIAHQVIHRKEVEEGK